MGSDEVEKEKQSGIGKQILKIAFSHIGLCVIVVIYCVIGGLLFELLEKQNEIAACIDAQKEYDDMENNTLFSLLDVILSTQIDSYSADRQLNMVFESFRNNTISIGYGGEWCEGYGKTDGPVHEWTLAGGIFFSMTVITTIGYGHISPKTVWGRIFCISYAMLGIPLMLMFLANIGDVLADIFRYIYAKIICCGCLKKKKQKRRQIERQSSSIEDEPGVSKRLSFDPLCHSKKTDMFSEPSAFGSKEGLITTSVPPDSTGMQQKYPNPQKIRALSTSEVAERARLRRMISSNNSQKEPLVLDEDSDEEEDEEWEEISKVAVPLTISMGIIGLYIIGGAILFKYWEGWDMLQSSYFCFITLSTIGFGDVTPGRDFTDPTANARLIIGTVYSIFGMAILSMCFTLMQEEIISKFRWIGRKLGVVGEDDDEEDEELDRLSPVGVNEAKNNQNQENNAKLWRQSHYSQNQSDC